MANGIRWLFIASVLVGCVTGLELSPDADIQCESDEQCPTGQRCATLINSCVAVEADLESGVTLVAGSVSQNQTLLGRSGELALEFELDGELAATPRLTLQSREFTVTALGANRFSGTLGAQGEFSEGVFPILLSFVDARGVETLDLTIGETVTVDFQPPQILDARLEDPRPVRTGARAAILFTVDDLGAAGELIVELADGRSLARDTTVTAPNYRFTHTVEPSDEEQAYVVFASATDGAGNAGAEVSIPAFTVDRTPPAVTLSQVSAPGSALRPGDRLSISVPVTELLDGFPSLSLVSGDASLLELQAEQQSGLILSYGGILPLSLTDGVYSVRFSGALDLAGNEGPDVDLATLEIDASAPSIADFALAPTVAGCTAATNSISLTFSLDEAVGAQRVEVSVGSESVPCVESLNGAGADYDCGFLIDETFPSCAGDATIPVTLFVRDAAGNTAFDVGPPLSLDFTAPTLRDASSVQFSRADFLNSAVVSPTEVFLNDSELLVSFFSSEVLAGAPVLSLAGAADPGVLIVSSSGTFHDGSFTPAASLPDGDYQLEARMVDEAGNEATVALGTIHSDQTAPTIGASELSQTTLRRAPWGDSTRSAAYAELELPLIFDVGDSITVLSGANPLSAAVLAVRSYLT
ncbi:MAG: Ig-like domain repeat protein, partial [Myxococcota bacterium]